MNNEAVTDDAWALVEVTVDSATAEIVADSLWAFGVVAVEEVHTTPGIITLRTSMGHDPHDFARKISDLYPEAGVSVVRHDRAVADTWRVHAEPTWVTESVVLVPAWCDAPDNSQPVFVEPLDTFGLGNHPTTVLALRLSLTHASHGSTVFDLGSGSGVLAVALAKLAGCTSKAFDIAESSKQALIKNMILNNVTTCEWSEGFPDAPVDIVVANILAPVLEAEADAVTKCVKSGGVVVLSGMRDDQVNRVVAGYQRFTEIERVSLDGWSAVVLRKR